MDSKLRRMAVLSSLTAVLLVALLVLYTNKMTGGKQPTGSGAGGQSALQQSTESAVQTTGQTENDGRIGDDLSAFLRDSTFFDQEENPVLEAARDMASRLSMVVTSVEKDLRIQIVNQEGEPVTGDNIRIWIKTGFFISENCRQGNIMWN